MNFSEILPVVLERFQERYKWIIGLFLVFLASYIYYDDQPGQPYLLLATLFVVTAVLLVVLPKKLSLATATIIIIFGSFSSFLSPIVDVPDEHVHYARSSYLSDGQLHLSNNHDELQISEDINVVMDNIGQSMFQEDRDRPHSEETVSFPSVLFTNVYYNIGYLPQALGLKVSELLNLSVFKGYLIGRLMNVLAYASLVVLAVRLAGRLGQLVAVCALLPMNIFLAGSFNQDAVSLGVMFVTLGLFFKFLDDTYQVGLKDMAIYTLLCLMIATMKLPYILFIGLPFFLPYKKFKNLSHSQIWLTKFISVFLLLVTAAWWYKLSGQLKAPEFNTNDQLKLVNSSLQFQEILRQPLLYFKAVVRNVTDYMLNLDSTNTFGLLTYGISRFSSLLFIFYFCLVLNHANIIQFSRWTKLGIGLVTIGIASGISVALLLSWTPVGQPIILGVQGRYFIGLYPLILVLLAANNKTFERCRGFLKQETVLTLATYFIVLMLLTTILRYYN